jgi:hypothetical protein
LDFGNIKDKDLAYYVKPDDAGAESKNNHGNLSVVNQILFSIRP